MIKLHINSKEVSVSASEDTPLLWVLRDILKLNGTKFGCGAGLCGACTVHIGGKAVRSCVVPVSAVADKAITTIEGLSSDGPHPVQQAWHTHRVSQCGYCQPGMIMAAAALLQNNPQPNDKDIDEQITNICRCGTYPRVRKAIKTAAKISSGDV